MTRADRFEAGLQLTLMLGVGGVAAAASWSHVLHLAAEHGQGGWLSWAVAACTETAAVSGGLEVRRRRRASQSTRTAMAVVVAATGLQLSAQIADAERSPWGVILAAVPAVTFLVLVKLALSRDSHPTSMGSAPGADVHEVAPDPAPVAAPERPVRKPRKPAVKAPVRAPLEELLPVGRSVAEQLAGQGKRLSRRALQQGLRERGHSISTDRATELLARLEAA